MGVAFIVNRGGSGAPAPKIPPDNVSNLSVTPGNQRITLKWADPDDMVIGDIVLAEWADTAVVRKAGGYPADENDGVVVVTNSVRNQYATTGFTDNTNLTLLSAISGLARGRDNAINRNVENRISGTPNEVPTGNVTGFTATAGYQSVTLKWTEPTAAFWQSTKIVRKIGGYPADENDGTTVVNSTVRNQYATTGYTDSGLTNDTVYYYQAFPIAQDGSVNRNAANRVSATPARLVIASVPTQSGTLTYNGSSQSPTWNNYDSAKMTLGGTTSSTDAGTFTATFTPTAMYKWSDGTTTAKSVSWTIGKAAGSLSITPTTLTLDSSNLTKTIIVTSVGNGVISAVSSDINVAAVVSVPGNTVTVSHVNQTTGTATVTVSVAAGTNHTAPANQTCAVSAEFISRTFGSNTWAQISAASAMIEATGIDGSLTSNQAAIAAWVYSNFGWSVGDTKNVLIGGTSYPFRIIGFNHDDKVSNGKAGITLDMTRSYGTTVEDRANMNATSLNPSVWDTSRLRTDTTGISMVTLLAQLPPDLQTAIKQVNKPTRLNPYNSVIIQSQDKLFVLSGYEVFGVSNYVLAGDGARYAYYTINNTNGARIKQQPNGTPWHWWLRSADGDGMHGALIVASTGVISNTASNGAMGVSFGLCV